MLNGNRVIAIIPARGGSKRLPRKNILSFAGKPLIAWTIEAAIRSSYIDEVIVSTDDIEIADTAINAGASVPELRPKYLSDDISKTIDVIIYTLEKQKNVGDIVVVLQPTSPLRDFNHINDSLNLFAKKNAKSVISVTQCEHPPEWANTLEDNLCMDGFVKPEMYKRSQELKTHYRLNGAIYIFDVPYIIKNRTIDYSTSTYAFIMGNEASIDIDNKIDFQIAEAIFLNKKIV